MKKIRTVFSIAAVVLIASDQFIKHLVAVYLLPVRSVTVIQGLFNLTYVENRGASFGIFQGKALPLAIVTGVAIIAALFAVYSAKIRSRFLQANILVIAAGGIGNFIDRVFRGYVIDYLDFSAIFGFPVFNLADCCVVVGTVTMLLYILILEKKDLEKSG